MDFLLGEDVILSEFRSRRVCMRVAAASILRLILHEVHQPLPPFFDSRSSSHSAVAPLFQVPHRMTKLPPPRGPKNAGLIPSTAEPSQQEERMARHHCPVVPARRRFGFARQTLSLLRTVVSNSRLKTQELTGTRGAITRVAGTAFRRALIQSLFFRIRKDQSLSFALDVNLIAGATANVAVSPSHACCPNAPLPTGPRPQPFPLLAPIPQGRCGSEIRQRTFT
ncbi:hypothetical protein BDK51DRAFT_46423 [Blyttiomyces helicus]|uniref:Uncharacterized protein n=1 Tax=Blyttiomyces helicus TaxID=388810 RepID=A0A4P9WF48_9FUNG|nr:hypothetical protein BDK51DRAFT_46423 [Blyttiomyces helicus]|eukprot:RKO90445.1 hypothetical protein BDK51DRAFT_46423 [Blyttiomyces helicus]